MRAANLKQIDALGGIDLALLLFYFRSMAGDDFQFKLLYVQAYFQQLNYNF